MHILGDPADVLCNCHHKTICWQSHRLHSHKRKMFCSMFLSHIFTLKDKMALKEGNKNSPFCRFYIHRQYFNLGQTEVRAQVKERKANESHCHEFVNCVKTKHKRRVNKQDNHTYVNKSQFVVSSYSLIFLVMILRFEITFVLAGNVPTRNL